MTVAAFRIGAVLIGRNEGARLKVCLASVTRDIKQVVYVDSGSTDDSVVAAQATGAQVVMLDTRQGFTAARARNAGFDALMAQEPAPDLVQFIDGDCAMRKDWLETAAAFLQEHPKVAAVCGRRRERFPEASVYNRLIDLEWSGAAGEVKSCGGDVLMRAEALRAVGGYDPTLIAGEEPELCVRLRQADWQIWRLDTEMTWHDAALTRFGQWWKRTRRAGHAFAEGAVLHGAPPERHNVAQTRRALLWGAILPLVIGFGTLLISPWILLFALLWPLKIARLIRQGRAPVHALFLTFGNLPEALGVMSYHWSRLTGGRRQIIEYK